MTDSIKNTVLSTKEPSSSPQVLCTDLDGTIVATDLLWESFVLLIRQQPWVIFLCLNWLAHGVAHVKKEIAKRVEIDVSTLPYRTEIVSFLREQKESGKTLVLVTGSDQKFARAVAKHLDLFETVIASDGTINVTGKRKRLILESAYGLHGFDYMGDAAVDLQIWPSAHSAILVHPSHSVLHRAKHCAHIQRVFSAPGTNRWSLFKVIRIQQWIKNLLIFLPLMTAHDLFDHSKFMDASMAFISFSLCASGLYILNDLLDLPADRRHPKKAFRPFACGALSLKIGVICIPVLLSTAFLLAWMSLPLGFLELLLLYTTATSLYSFYLKKLVLLDVLTLTSLYTLRILAGGVAVSLPISAWLLAFSMFFFLSLALGKRHAELQFRKVSQFQGIERRAYIGGDKEILAVMGVVSGYLSVLVLALYINSQEVLELYQHPHMLWLACPLLLYWISRTWLFAHRGHLDDDPLMIALKDPSSYILVIVISALGLLAM